MVIPFSKKRANRSMLHLLAEASKPRLFFSIVCGVVSGLSSMLLISQINSLLYEVNALNDTQHIQLFILVLLFARISGVSSQVSLIQLGQKTMLAIRLQIVRRILSTPYHKVEEIGANKLYTALTDDVGAVANATQALPHLAISGGVIVGGFAYLGWLSPSILILTLTFVLVGATISRKLMHRARKHLEEARLQSNSLFGHFHAIIYGAKELKLNQLRQHTFIEKELTPTANVFQDSNIRGLTSYVLVNQWGEFIFFTLIGLLLFGDNLFNFHDNQIALSACVTILYLIGPIGSMLNIFPILARANVALKQIDSLQLNNAIKHSTYSNKYSPDKAVSIKLENTSFSYRTESEDTFTLGPVNLELHPSEIVFLVGSNGSGKSTLLKLLTGLYQPDEGNTYVNGKHVTTEDDRHAYRQYFTTVFSDFYLFERLPSEYGKLVDSIAQEHLEKLELDNKVNISNGKLSTIALSQGQRKRLALLCAYLENRPVYIFDEWAADQDPIFRDFFYTSLLPELKQQGKTILIASHDDRYFHLADRIIKLEYGKTK